MRRLFAIGGDLRPTAWKTAANRSKVLSTEGIAIARISHYGCTPVSGRLPPGFYIAAFAHPAAGPDGFAPVFLRSLNTREARH